MFSAQTKRDIKISELHDSVFEIARRCGLENEMSIIISGMLGTSTSDDHMLATLFELNSKMQSLDEYGAWKYMKPTGLSSETLRERAKNAAVFDKDANEIRKLAKDYQKDTNPPLKESVAARDKRMLLEIPCIMQEHNCKEAKALRIFREQEIAAGRPVISDLPRAYRRAKANAAT